MRRIKTEDRNCFSLLSLTLSAGNKPTVEEPQSGLNLYSFRCRRTAFSWVSSLINALIKDPGSAIDSPQCVSPLGFNNTGPETLTRHWRVKRIKPLSFPPSVESWNCFSLSFKNGSVDCINFIQELWEAHKGRRRLGKYLYTAEGVHGAFVCLCQSIEKFKQQSRLFSLTWKACLDT